MLAGDPIEATEQAQSLLKDRTLTEYYEQILMGALRLAWANSQRGRLQQPETQRIRDTVSELVEDLESRRIRVTHLQRMQVQQATSHNWRKASRPRFHHCDRSIQVEGTVICIPGLGLLDETVAMPFAQLLRREGIPAEARETETLSMSKLFSLEQKTSGSSVFATWNTRRQRNCTTRRVACAERQPACPH